MTGADTILENVSWDETAASSPPCRTAPSATPMSVTDTASSGYNESSGSASEDDDMVLGEFLWDALGGFDPNLQDLAELCD